MKKPCIECGEEMMGRADKKFCSMYCRSAYNNKLNSDNSKTIRNINNVLRKNRRILEELNPSGKTNIHKDQLSKKGFDFTFITNIYTTKTGKHYRYCYEQGYLELDNNYYLLIKNNTL